MRLGYIVLPEQPNSNSSCFNEAEAHAPRIHPNIPRFISTVSPASMRPRRMRLGYLVAMRMIFTDGFSLQ